MLFFYVYYTKQRASLSRNARCFYLIDLQHFRHVSHAVVDVFGVWHLTSFLILEDLENDLAEIVASAGIVDTVVVFVAVFAHTFCFGFAEIFAAEQAVELTVDIFFDVEVVHLFEIDDNNRQRCALVGDSVALGVSNFLGALSRRHGFAAQIKEHTLAVEICDGAEDGAVVAIAGHVGWHVDPEIFAGFLQRDDVAVNSLPIAGGIADVNIWLAAVAGLDLCG